MVETDHDLELAQVVQVNQGKLSGQTGVIIGFRGGRCLIELDGARGVLLLIDAVSVTGKSLAGIKIFKPPGEQFFTAADQNQNCGSLFPHGQGRDHP